MTLADTRSTVTTPAVPVHTVSASATRAQSSLLSHNQLEMMRAFFCYEFEVAQLDHESVPAATEDAIDEWVEALEMSGLFASAELRTIGNAFRSEPSAVVSLLVGNVDEIAARRDFVAAPAAPTAPTAPAAPAARNTAYLRAS